MSPSASPANPLKTEWPLVIGVVSTVLFLVFGGGWLTELSNPLWAVPLFLWLFVAILVSAFGVVRHADCLAVKLGEPLGTLILTLSVIGMEVIMVAALMLTGNPHPAMARDTMFAVVMIVLNGLLGVSLVLGGWRHHEQHYNLQGAASFLTMLVPLAACGLILPYYTATSTSPALTQVRATTLMLVTIGLYCVFLAVQTRRHPHYFQEKGTASTGEAIAEEMHFNVRSVPYHAILLIVWLLPVVILAKRISVVLDFEARQLGAPAALSGVVVAVLILAPEGMAGIRAAWENKIQRAVNLLFGAALSTIALTVPAVILISLVTGKTVQLGLEPVNQILLIVTLAVSTLTCLTGQTNVLNGFVHLVLFVVYFILIFAP
jgi:Ca2+:H+ antiporter